MNSENSFLHIEMNLKYQTQEDLIRKLIQRTECTGIDHDAIYQEVLKREETLSTAIGEGIFIPHARIHELEHLFLVVARLNHPLDIETPDDIKPEFAVLMLIPEENPMDALKFMADFAGAVHKDSLIMKLKNARDEEEFRRLLMEVDTKRNTLLASDLMTPCEHFASMDMPLKAATLKMMDWDVETIPVLRNHTIVGELSCDELFKIGIPNFFTQLQSVGFIRQFDPFEAYFKTESMSCVCDVMNYSFQTFPPDTTLIEIVFEISVKKNPVLYIVNEQKELLGIITRNRLLERVINM